MRAVDRIAADLQLARKKSILTWRAVPKEHVHWKANEDAMSIIETIRHILDCDKWYLETIKHRSSIHLNYVTLLGDRPYVSVEQEVKYNENDHETFIAFVKSLNDNDLDSILIERKKGSISIGDFLAQISYHEAFHTGQLQFSLRLLNIKRPDIWY